MDKGGNYKKNVRSGKINNFLLGTDNFIKRYHWQLMAINYWAKLEFYTTHTHIIGDLIQTYALILRVSVIWSLQRLDFLTFNWQWHFCQRAEFQRPLNLIKQVVEQNEYFNSISE